MVHVWIFSAYPYGGGLFGGKRAMPSDTPWWQCPPFTRVVSSSSSYPHCKQITAERADFHPRDFDGITTDMLEAAIRDGLDPNLESDSGGCVNLLQFAVLLRRLDLVECLVRAGATLDGGLCEWNILMESNDIHLHIHKNAEEKDNILAQTVQALGVHALHWKVGCRLFRLLQFSQKTAFALLCAGVNPWTGALNVYTGGFCFPYTGKYNRRYVSREKFRRCLAECNIECGYRALQNRMKGEMRIAHRAGMRGQAFRTLCRQLEAGQACIRTFLSRRESVVTAAIALRRIGFSKELSQIILHKAYTVNETVG